MYNRMSGAKPGFMLVKNVACLEKCPYSRYTTSILSSQGFSCLSVNFTNMDADILKQIKEKLQSRKNDLEKELAKISRLDEHGREANYEDIGDDEDVNAQEVSSYADNQSLVAELSKNLDDVNKSLAKIESGEYGKCRYCKKEINPQRLLARPSSGACISCKATLQGEMR